MKIAAARALAELGARGRARRGRGRLWRAAEIRARLHHPGAVRPAPDLPYSAGGRQGRHGYRRRAQADRRHGRLSGATALAPRSGRRRLAARLRAAAAAAAARGVRRGRGRAGDPRRRELRRAGPGHRAAGRPRGPRARKRRARSASSSATASRSSMRGCRIAMLPMRPISTSGCSARASSSAIASAWSTRTATISPPAWSRWATPTPW